MEWGKLIHCRKTSWLAWIRDPNHLMPNHILSHWAINQTALFECSIYIFYAGNNVNLVVNSCVAMIITISRIRVAFSDTNIPYLMQPIRLPYNSKRQKWKKNTSEAHALFVHTTTKIKNAARCGMSESTFVDNLIFLYIFFSTCIGPSSRVTTCTQSVNICNAY